MLCDLALFKTNHGSVQHGRQPYLIYLPIDQALFVDVLPDKNAAGRDLGIANMATNLGQALGPILAGQVVALTSGYAMVWLVAFVLVLVSAVVIVPVKRVR